MGAEVEFVPLSVRLRMSPEARAVDAALPRAAKCYRGKASPRVVTAAKREGKYVAEMRDIVRAADHPEELHAYLDALFASRDVTGSLDMIAAADRRDGHTEADDREHMAEMFAVLSDPAATRSRRLAAIDAALDAKRADIANDLYAAAELLALRAKIAERRA